MQRVVLPYLPAIGQSRGHGAHARSRPGNCVYALGPTCMRSVSEGGHPGRRKFGWLAKPSFYETAGFPTSVRAIEWVAVIR